MADDEIDRLYVLPLEEFVRERDALARRLRAEGDRAAADEVKQLPKPTRAAWAVNRATREHPDDLRALVSAGKALARAQKDLLAGANPAELRDAAREARGAVDRLVAAAGETGATAEKVRATLHAATVDPEVRDEVAGGRLARERSASGFGGLDGFAVAPPGPRGQAQEKKGGATKTKRAPRGDTSKEREREERERAKAQAAERKRRDALRRAKEAEAEAEGELAGAERALAQVEAAVVARRAEVEAARRRLNEARRRRERAERA